MLHYLYHLHYMHQVIDTVTLSVSGSRNQVHYLYQAADTPLPEEPGHPCFSEG